MWLEQETRLIIIGLYENARSGRIYLPHTPDLGFTAA